MRANKCIGAIGISLLLCTAASADEMIHFTNGSYMKILGHEVRGDMIKVQLEGNGSMGFPTRMVDKIESGSAIVYGGPANTVFPNQMAPPLPGSEYQVRSNAVVGLRSQEARDADPDIMANRARAKGMQANPLLSGHQAEAQFEDGKIGAAFAPGPAGTRRVGSKLVVGSEFSNHAVPFRPQRLQLRGESPASGDQPEKTPDR